MQEITKEKERKPFRTFDFLKETFILERSWKKE